MPTPPVPSTERRPAVSIVTCTYNRPDLLLRAVRGCLRNASGRHISYEIVVADNSPEGYAEPLLTASLDKGTVGEGGPVRVVRATPPNIAIARNAGVSVARAPLIVFLDDDLSPDPGWLEALTETLETTGADVVAGPVSSTYVEPDGRVLTGTAEAEANALCWWCSRDIAVPSGTPITVDGPKRTRAIIMGTENTLWRVATTLSGEQPFDPAFGSSGGEDVDIFMRMERQGRRFAWCTDARVRSIVPVSRLSLRYQLMRGFASAQAYTAAAVKNDRNPTIRCLRILGRSLLQVAVYALLVPITPLLSKPQRRSIMVGLSMGLGKMAWWRKLNLYQRESDSRTTEHGTSP